MSRVIFIIGVSGSGKSSVAKMLSESLSLIYFDADDHHPKENIAKMSKGISLTDEDRHPWLNSLNQLAKQNSKSGCIIACSALKQNYRDKLSKNLESEVIWVYLKGDFDSIYKRMSDRKNHFMKPEMLQSQFNTLEEPIDAIQIDISDTIENIVKKLKDILI